MDSHTFNRLLQKIKYDKNAVLELYNEFFPKIVIHLKRRFGKLVSPEDIAHDVFLSIMSMKEIRPVEYPTTWFYKLADNKAIDCLRQQNKEIELTEYFAVPFDLDNLVLKEDVKNTLAELDEESQMILYLHVWEGYKHEEIAELLHLSHANVRTKVSRAYAALRHLL